MRSSQNNIKIRLRKYANLHMTEESQQRCCVHHVHRDEHVNVDEVDHVHCESRSSTENVCIGRAKHRGVPPSCDGHNKIQRFYTGGQSLQDVAASPRQGVVQPSELPMIGIVRHEMKWYSRNNWRLACFGWSSVTSHHYTARCVTKHSSTEEVYATTNASENKSFWGSPLSGGGFLQFAWMWPRGETAIHMRSEALWQTLVNSRNNR